MLSTDYTIKGTQDIILFYPCFTYHIYFIHEQFILTAGQLIFKSRVSKSMKQSIYLGLVFPYLGGVHLEVSDTVQKLVTQDKLDSWVCAGSSQDHSQTQGLS